MVDVMCGLLIKIAQTRKNKTPQNRNTRDKN